MVMAISHWNCLLKVVGNFSSLKVLQIKHVSKVYLILATGFWFESRINSGKTRGIHRPNNYNICYINKNVMQNTAVGQSFHFTAKLNSILRTVGNILSKVLHKTVTDAEQQKGISGTSWFQIYRKEYSWLQWSWSKVLLRIWENRNLFFLASCVSG